MSEGWLPNGQPDPDYQEQTWYSPEEKTKILIKYERQNYEEYGSDKYGRVLGQRKERKKVTNYTPPKKKRKKK